MSDTPKKTRSGTEKRGRQPRVYSRVTDAELAKIEMDAAAQGLSVGSYLRWLAIDRPQTRPTRRALPGEALLRELRGEAGHVGSNLAQLLRKENRGEAVPVKELKEAANAVNDCWLHIIEMLKGAQ